MPSSCRTIPTSEQMLDSILVDPSTSSNPSSDFTPNVRFSDVFQEYREIPDHSVEGGVQSSPTGVSNWGSPSPMPPTGPFNFPHYMSLDENPNFAPWDDHHPFFPPSHAHYGGAPTAFHSSFSLPVEKVPQAGDPHVQNRDNHDTTPHSNMIPVAELAATRNEDIHVGNVTDFPTFHSAFSHDVTVDPGHLSQASNSMTLFDGQIRPHSPDEAHQLPLAEPFTAQSPRAFPMHSCDPHMGAKDAPDFNKGNPEAIRKRWIASYSRFVEDNNVLKIFSKHAKEKVATLNTLKASAARRKNPAKFKCMIQGCSADFTRKHNLENHLKSHCGVTDRLCHRCGKGFTTIPVWRRHQKSCGKSKVSPISFLDQLTVQHHDSA